MSQALIVIGILAATFAALLLIVRVIAGPGEPIPRPSRRRVAAWAGVAVVVGGAWAGEALLGDPTDLPPCPTDARSLVLVMKESDGEVRIDHYNAVLPDGSTLPCQDDAHGRVGVDRRDRDGSASDRAMTSTRVPSD